MVGLCDAMRKHASLRKSCQTPKRSMSTLIVVVCSAQDVWYELWKVESSPMRYLHNSKTGGEKKCWSKDEYKYTQTTVKWWLTDEKDVAHDEMWIAFDLRHERMKKISREGKIHAQNRKSNIIFTYIYIYRKQKTYTNNMGE